ncbi:MAG: hypothetical protein JKX70_09675 [Phycisphaerales bacterium]|nr:hypothetical protein [Phycisphaerales bacterium]
MSASVDQNVVCPECGHDPVEIGGEVVVYAQRVRRRVLLVLLVLVILLGVLALPWVQVAIGHWSWGFGHQLRVGNIFAVMDDRTDIIPGRTQYRALAEPPMRWLDLVLVAQGDGDAIEHFRRAVEGTVEYPSNFEKMYSSYEFTVGTPRYFFNPDNGGYTRTQEDGYQYTLLNKEYASVGWPDPWIGDLTTHWYRPDPERFSESGLRSIEDDLVHIAVVDRTIRWRNILFIAGLVVLSGNLARRVCVWKRVGRRRSFVVGFVVTVVLAAGVLVAGMPWRHVPGHGVTGHINPATGGMAARSWDSDELEAILSTDEQVRVLAETLLEDFGEMTDPNELVALGIGSSVGERMYALSFGYGQVGKFRLMQYMQGGLARLEDDGSHTSLPVLEEGVGWSLRRANGSFIFGRSDGEPAMILYGGLIDYRNVFFLCVGLYMLLRVIRWVGWKCSRRVQRRRIRRGICAWCGYPCEE